MRMNRRLEGSILSDVNEKRTTFVGTVLTRTDWLYNHEDDKPATDKRGLHQHAQLKQRTLCHVRNLEE